MVDKCANPHCEATFQYSSRGQLFPFELRSPNSPWCKCVNFGRFGGGAICRDSCVWQLMLAHLRQLTLAHLWH